MIEAARLGGMNTWYPSSFHNGVVAFFRQVFFRNLKAAPRGVSEGYLAEKCLPGKDQLAAEEL
ncbi:MAG: hypothetical protein CL797_11690 [Chromatiales bacterium]|nr:hypothetical protein [Chromatiales bacterium]